MTNWRCPVADLKPCPFCGGEPLVLLPGDHVACRECCCVADGPAAWNTRAPCPECERQRERVAALEAVAEAARAFREETNGLLRAALGGPRPAIKATSYQDICAALAALDAKPQQGQPEGGKEE